MNIFCKFFNRVVFKGKSKIAFSLVEMLMALLVASLLLVAIAPVVTRRVEQNVNTSFDPVDRTTKEEILFGDEECPLGSVQTAEDGSQYCEGTYVVPPDYTGVIRVTVVGAGGGGGAAPTAGFTEYTYTGTTPAFTVPAMTNKIEATVVGGGDGGNAGPHKEKHQTFVTSNLGGMTTVLNEIVTVESDGTGDWDIPPAAQGKDMAVWACGGGGGGGSTQGTITYGENFSGRYAYGGGSGGYVDTEIVNFASNKKITYFVGGGGGGGVHSYNNVAGQMGGAAYGGGNGYGSTALPPAATLLTSTKAGGAGGNSISVVHASCGSGSYTDNLSGGGGGNPNGGIGNAVHWGCCYTGGGGGGGAASQIVTGTKDNYKIWVNAPGGGGGAGIKRNNTTTSCPAGVFGGGGGGGGEGGGAGGGNNNDYVGKGGTGGGDASGSSAGTVTTKFGSKYCNGGTGGVNSSDTSVSNSGYRGKSGAIRIKYLDYLTGGAGGNSGGVLENVTKTVTPNTTYSVYVGKAGEGGKKGYIYNPAGTPEAGKTPGDTINPNNDKTPGEATRIYTSAGNLITSANGSAVTGYSSSTNAGGNGGKVTTTYTTCTIGTGGATKDTSGGNASGYGCGGGGGFSLSDGGNGSNGYARIAWNKYWDAALNGGSGAYKLANTGAGGGGASGSVMTYSIKVMGGQVIRIRIGKGGNGAKIVNNSLVNAQRGGDTVFGEEAIGELRAGGGGAGGSAFIYNNALVNGAGGLMSQICRYGGKSFWNNGGYCRKGANGSAAVPNTTTTGMLKGGDGASLATFGTGGEGGISGTSNYAGSNATEFGAGGGGAGIHDLGNSSVSNSASGTNNGGAGANGKIIIELYET